MRYGYRRAGDQGNFGRVNGKFGNFASCTMPISCTANSHFAASWQADRDANMIAKAALAWQLPN